MRGDIETLRVRFPWPDSRPAIPFDAQGWFGWCHRLMLRSVMPQNTQLVLELGSWLGRSTRYFLNAFPKGTVIAVDHWGRSELIANDDPTSEAKMSNLYDRFVSNNWSFKKRLIPVRASTVAGMQVVNDCGLKPDLIYIDANHTHEDMRQDLNMAFSLFPEARLCGDDYGGKWTGVKDAIDQFCRGNGCRILTVEHAWAAYRQGESIPVVKQEDLVRAIRQARIERPK